jgi:hypothetical protein
MTKKRQDYTQPNDATDASRNGVLPQQGDMAPPERGPYSPAGYADALAAQRQVLLQQQTAAFRKRQALTQSQTGVASRPKSTDSGLGAQQQPGSTPQTQRRARLRCPVCSAMVILPAIECFECGANLRTGYRERKDRFPLIKLLTVAATLLCFGMLSLFYFGVFNMPSRKADFINSADNQAGSKSARIASLSLLRAEPVRWTSAPAMAVHVFSEATSYINYNKNSNQTLQLQQPASWVIFRHPARRGQAMNFNKVRLRRLPENQLIMLEMKEAGNRGSSDG